MPQAYAPGPAPVVRRFVDQIVGNVEAYCERTVPDGEARVWSVERDGEIVAWLKRHKQRERAVREVNAYTQWLPLIGWGTPVFLGVCPQAPNALLTAPAAGSRADQAALSTTQQAQAFFSLGRFLAALHMLDIPDTRTDSIDDEFQVRLMNCCHQAEQIVDQSQLDQVHEAFSGPIGSRLRRVPCHRDLHMHNVFVDPLNTGCDVTVIDFGQARHDVWLADLVKLFPVASPRTLPMMKALLEGYGRRLTAEETEALLRLRTLYGLLSLARAAEQGNGRGVRFGRHVLTSALEALGL